MMIVTFAVWIALYARRIHYFKSHRVHPQKVDTPQKVEAAIPDEIQYPAHNFKNLFELPVLFYFLCLYLFASGNVHAWYVYGAWTFVGLRAIHSLVQCTTNIVMRRFVVYMAGAIVLWLMVLRAAIDLL